MQMQPRFAFPPFRLDLDNEQLQRHSQTIALRPKTFAVLRYLVAHPNVLVTKDALLDAVWAGTVVSEAALKTCIRELRQALGDDDKAPRFIETVHGRGYRFIAPLSTSPPLRQKASGKWQKASPTFNLYPPSPTLVGRQSELACLQAYWEKARQGKRQIVFVTGEPGIGKTTIVEAFLAEVGAGRRACPAPESPRGIAPTPDLWMASGQCIEHYGASEAYMPVLEALGRLCRDPASDQLVDILNRYAPTWLVQMPALLNADDVERLQRTVQGATHGRMLREMAEALEACTAERPLILCLEDLHWSDVSTLELLSVLARRHEPARLLVLGTYRPVEMLTPGHPLRPLKQELQLHQQCEEIRLGLLTEDEVAVYLQSRFSTRTPDSQTFSALAHAIHRRTEGNPLFMVNVVDYVTAQGVLNESGEPQSSTPIDVPTNIQQMIEKQLDRLSPEEQWVLEVASVAGADFSAAAVAAGTKMTTSEVETCCTGLVRREQFLRTQGVSEWPDGTVATRYSFLHALYQEVLYERTPVGQRVNLHRWIGEREEQAYGDHASTLAAELAVHFERGREYRKSITYLQQAGENALQRSAHQEAIDLLTRGLALLNTLPDTPERARQELTLQLLLGVPLMATKGWSAPEVERAYIRAQELCKQLGETRQLFSVLRGLWECYDAQGKLVAARELGEQLLSLAESIADPALLLVAHNALADTLYCEGKFVAALAHAEHGTALYNLHQHHTLATLYGTDPGVACLSFEAFSSWLLGYPDQSRKKMGAMLTLTQELPHHPYSLAHAQTAATWLAQWRREGQATLAHAAAAISLSTTQEFPMWVAWTTVPQGWALAKQGEKKEGLACIHHGLAVYRSIGGEYIQSYLLALLAETYGDMGRIEKGLAVLAEALAAVDRTGEHFWEAELYRLKGELLLQQLKIKNVE